MSFTRKRRSLQAREYSAGDVRMSVVKCVRNRRIVEYSFLKGKTQGSQSRKILWIVWRTLNSQLLMRLNVLCSAPVSFH